MAADQKDLPNVMADDLVAIFRDMYAPAQFLSFRQKSPEERLAEWRPAYNRRVEELFQALRTAEVDKATAGRTNEALRRELKEAQQAQRSAVAEHQRVREADSTAAEQKLQTARTEAAERLR